MFLHMSSSSTYWIFKWEPVFKTNCFCRKPYPGMFLEAAFNRNINLEESLMVGDSELIEKQLKMQGSLNGLFNLISSDIQ